MNTCFNVDVIDDVICLYLFLSQENVTIARLSNVIFGLDVYYLSKYKKPLIGGVYANVNRKQVNVNVFEYLYGLKTIYKKSYLCFIGEHIEVIQYPKLENLSKEELIDVTTFFISVLSTQNGESFDKYLDTKTNLSKIDSDCCYLPIIEYFNFLTRGKRILLPSGDNAYPINLRNVLFSIFNNEEVAKEIYHNLSNIKISNLKINTCTITLDINEIPYNFSYESLGITKNSTVCIVNNNLKVDMKNYTPYSLLEIHKEKEVELEDLPF